MHVSQRLLVGVIIVVSLAGGHDDGPPSADAGHGLIFVTDRRVGAGVDVIDYNPTLAHLYLPGATSATMAIVGVSASGILSLLGTIATARDAHCVAADIRTLQVRHHRSSAAGSGHT